MDRCTFASECRVCSLDRFRKVHALVQLDMPGVDAARPWSSKLRILFRISQRPLSFYGSRKKRRGKKNQNKLEQKEN